MLYLYPVSNLSFHFVDKVFIYLWNFRFNKISEDGSIAFYITYKGARI